MMTGAYRLHHNVALIKFIVPDASTEIPIICGSPTIVKRDQDANTSVVETRSIYESCMGSNTYIAHGDSKNTYQSNHGMRQK